MSKGGAITSGQRVDRSASSARHSTKYGFSVTHEAIVTAKIEEEYCK